MYGISDTYGMAKIGTTGSASIERRLEEDAVRSVVEPVVDEVGAEDRRDQQQAQDQAPTALGEDASGEARSRPAAIVGAGYSPEPGGTMADAGVAQLVER